MLTTVRERAAEDYPGDASPDRSAWYASIHEIAADVLRHNGYRARVEGMGGNTSAICVDLFGTRYGDGVLYATAQQDRTLLVSFVASGCDDEASYLRSLRVSSSVADTLANVATLLARSNHVLAARPVRPVACRWADTGHGPCGGPSNGRECWDHIRVGRDQ